MLRWAVLSEYNTHINDLCCTVGAASLGVAEAHHRHPQGACRCSISAASRLHLGCISAMPRPHSQRRTARRARPRTRASSTSRSPSRRWPRSTRSTGARRGAPAGATTPCPCSSSSEALGVERRGTSPGGGDPEERGTGGSAGFGVVKATEVCRWVRAANLAPCASTLHLTGSGDSRGPPFLNMPVSCGVSRDDARALSVWSDGCDTRLACRETLERERTHLCSK